MQSMDSSIWSQLPTELIREIFLIIAHADPVYGGALRLVSTHANVWILPVLFKDIHLESPDQIIRMSAIISHHNRAPISTKVPLLSRPSTIPSRPISSYTISSLALVPVSLLPSSEDALSRVGEAFSQLKHLAITAGNISAHSFWLRKSSVFPTTLFILHLGAPKPVDYRLPLFKAVTHLFTPVLVNGIRESSVNDLENLTHLACHTRVNLSPFLMQQVSHTISVVLKTNDRLKHFVLALNSMTPFDVDRQFVAQWQRVLKPCMLDSRFTLIPYFRGTRAEWHMVTSGMQDTIWDRAQQWSNMTPAAQDSFKALNIARMTTGNSEIVVVDRSHSGDNFNLNKPKFDWHIDLVQTSRYQEPISDPARSLYPDTRYMWSL